MWVCNQDIFKHTILRIYHANSCSSSQNQDRMDTVDNYESVVFVQLRWDQRGKVSTIQVWWPELIWWTHARSRELISDRASDFHSVLWHRHTMAHMVLYSHTFTQTYINHKLNSKKKKLCIRARLWPIISAPRVADAEDFIFKEGLGWRWVQC